MLSSDFPFFFLATNNYTNTSCNSNWPAVKILHFKPRYINAYTLSRNARQAYWHTSSTHLIARTILYLSFSVKTGGPLCFDISAAHTNNIQITGTTNTTLMGLCDKWWMLECNTKNSAPNTYFTHPLWVFLCHKSQTQSKYECAEYQQQISNFSTQIYYGSVKDELVTVTYWHRCHHITTLMTKHNTSYF